MTRQTLLFLLVGVCVPVSAHADKWILGLELGAVFTPERDDRVDAGGLFSLTVGRSFALDRSAELAVGVDVPSPPGLTVQLPVSLRWWPTETGFSVLAAARPTFFRVGVCANTTDRCPLDDALEPRDRGGLALGMFGGVGAGYNRGYVYGDVSYVAGWARGLARPDGGERPRTGFYHGVLFSLGARL